MISRLVVHAGDVVRPRELQAYPRESGSQREDRLEPLRGARRHAELHLDATEQEEPLDALLLVARLGLFQERPRMLRPAGPDKEPGGLHVREPCRRFGAPPGSGFGVRSARDQSCDREQRARRSMRQHLRYCFVPPNHPCTTAVACGSAYEPSSTPPTSAAPGP